MLVPFESFEDLNLIGAFIDIFKRNLNFVLKKKEEAKESVVAFGMIDDDNFGLHLSNAVPIFVQADILLV